MFTFRYNPIPFLRNTSPMLQYCDIFNSQLHGLIQYPIVSWLTMRTANACIYVYAFIYNILGFAFKNITINNEMCQRRYVCV